VSAPETGPEPTPSPPPQEEKAPDPDPIYTEANRLLSAGETFEAEQKFREALRVEPAFLPAKIALARLLSEQADFEESLRLWEQVRREAPAGSLEAMDARLEIPSLKRRLELLEQDREVPPPRDPDSIAVPTPVPLRPAFPTPSVAVREQDSPLVVERIRLERYPQSPRYDEFRILTFDLVHQEGTPAVEAGSIKIRVTFFEQAGARVRQADIPNPRVVLDVEQGLSRDQRVEDLSAAYEVPPGRGRDGRSYYGAIIEVFVDGQEVHRAADPEFLLKFIR
jgi:tetratricopeptide (TPR) repeat protein